MHVIALPIILLLPIYTTARNSMLLFNDVAIVCQFLCSEGGDAIVPEYPLRVLCGSIFRTQSHCQTRQFGGLLQVSWNCWY